MFKCISISINMNKLNLNVFLMFFIHFSTYGTFSNKFWIFETLVFTLWIYWYSINHHSGLYHACSLFFSHNFLKLAISVFHLRSFFLSYTSKEDIKNICSLVSPNDHNLSNLRLLFSHTNKREDCYVIIQCYLIVWSK